MPFSTEQKNFIKKHHFRGHSVEEISNKINADPSEVKNFLQSISSNGSRGKNRLYNYLALLIPILFFLLLEGILQIINYGGNLDLFITPPGEYSDYKICNPYVGRRYFTLQSSVPDPSNDLFLKAKPENGYRIFVIGGSTAAGYPYSENLMFSRILNFRLTDAFPEKHIEIVNTATAAINSYTLLDFMDEILSNQPDAILIYAGHNEYYGALGIASAESLGKFRWVVRLYLSLRKYRTFLLVRDIVTKLQQWVGKLIHGDSTGDPSATLMERLVADQKIAMGSPVYELGKRQFKENLNDILKKAKEAHVRVLMSELVSNIRDLKPFESVTTKEFPPATEVYQNAQSLEKEQKYDQAREKYYLAKDLDALRFRAPEEFNKIIHELSAQYDVPVVPMKSVFQSASSNGLVGNNLMLEHLHPNIEGCFLLADAFFNSMKDNKFISDNWNEGKIKPASYYRNEGLNTELDSLYGDLRIRILKGGWPFKPKTAPNRALGNYHPSTRAESLAVKIWVDKKFTIERGHVEMAEYYLNRKDYLNAFKEFNSLIHLTPYNISPYIEAAKAQVNARQLEKVLPILVRSLEVEETAYANKWIGQILLDKGMTKKSLPYLEKAYELNDKDPQLLYNLSGAYALLARYEKANETLDELYQIDPTFPDAAILRRQLNQILNN